MAGELRLLPPTQERSSGMYMLLPKGDATLWDRAACDGVQRGLMPGLTRRRSVHIVSIAAAIATSDTAVVTVPSA